MTDRKGITRGARGAAAVLAAVLTASAAPAAPAAPASQAAPAPAAVQAPDERVASLRTQLEGIFRDNGWRSAEWSVLAVSLDTGDTLFARQPRTALAPASNMKLLVTAAALHHLGPDFRYQTLVLGDGPVRGGVLDGDLILYGTGDPGLSDRFHDSATAPFEALADRLLEAGVTAVRGDVVGDGSFFGGPLLAEGWDPRDLNDWFAAPAGALSFNENMVTLRVEPAATDGARPTIHTLPPEAGVPVMNMASTGRGRLRIEREHPDQPISIDGGIPRGGREVWRQMTVSDPTRYAAQIFRNVLEKKGIRVTGDVRTVEDPARSRVTGSQLWAPGLREHAPRILARHTSPPLHEYLAVVNKKSHNLLAETTLKTLGRIVGGDGSYAGGARVVEAFLADEVGVDTTGVEILDGSGLSELNRVAAADFVRVLAFMAESGPWDAYWETLPEAGNPRELRRMYRTPAAGNLRAKTGTIENVSALSGLVRSAAGERIAFSIIGNDVPSTWGAKRVEDRIGVGLASFERSFQVRDVRLAGPTRDAAPAVGTTRVAAAGEPGDAERVAAADPAPPPGSATESAVAAATAPEEDPPAPETRTHTVARGENLTVIARRHGVSVNDLVEANGGISPRSLQAGAELVIPVAEPGEPAPAEQRDPERHRVEAGENFTVIARRYGVSLNELIQANPDLSPRSLRPGQWVRIPDATNRDGR